MRVLIVDDDEDVVFSLQTILCAKGVEVVGTGTDGSEAVKLYEELQPDILLMDIQMELSKAKITLLVTKWLK